MEQKNVVSGDGYRISILTKSLIRIEYQKDNYFEDEMTQCVVNRDFPAVSFSQRETEDGKLCIETSKIILLYDQRKPSSMGLQITLKENGEKWNYGSYGSNLLGTARTLDETDGHVMLEPGIFSREGYSYIDDSNSARVIGDQVIPREHIGVDIYFFGYGLDFKGGLKDFYKLCGKAPMIPRYALGNWWSRFYQYTEKTYLELLDNFEKEGIPLSVAVIDMDWHLTDVDPKYGSGWTGYTFNKDFFPDPKRFLKKLHERKLATTLNLHPADGIRAFEEMYPQIAGMMGIDPESEQPVEFDMTDENYRKAVFAYINHPYEKKGVDFWWIDWQQGTNSKLSGVDPLWLLNHYFYEDMNHREKRPMIFSRYAGVGSHRYPIGFSGDTYASWQSLDLQPYFTKTASNIGYGWWSHDICGHMHGEKNSDCLIRWLQFGVFSSIMRLHSSGNEFFVKEPWKLEAPYRQIMTKYMRLRHQLIPYTYTMNYRAYSQDEPMIQPLYYSYPEETDAYEVRNEYAFGTELLVCPITEALNPVTRMSACDCYLPEGRYYDIFTGMIYEGRIRHKLYRNLENIPVLLKAGGILPLAKESGTNGTDNPEAFDIYIGAGANGEFSLYEDDGLSCDYQKEVCVTTQFLLLYDEDKKTLKFQINKAEGEQSLIPDKRAYVLHILGIAKQSSGEYDETKQELILDLGTHFVNEEIEILLEDVELAKNDYKELFFERVERAWIGYDDKLMLYDKLCDAIEGEELRKVIRELPCNEMLKDELDEIALS